MKGITLWQPWATSMATGAKHIETRSWSTKYRGPLAIHSAIKWDDYIKDICADINNEMKNAGFSQYVNISRYPKSFNHFIKYYKDGKVIIEDLHFGMILAVGYLVDCIEITPEYRDTLSPRELILGDYRDGRFAWVFEDIVKITPVPCKGGQRLWNVPNELEWHILQTK